MKLTNEMGLHDALFRAIQNRERWYTGAGEERFASVTELLKPPTMVALERAHADEVTEEAMDCLWTLMGSAMHRVIELSDDPEDKSTLAETRVSGEIAGKKITGGVDLISFTKRNIAIDGVALEVGSIRNVMITDFKFTSVWSYIFGDRIEEWEAQLNLYALLMRLNKSGPQPSAAEVCLIFRDWSQREAEKSDGRYPAMQSLVLPVMLWTQARAQSYAELRVRNLVRSLELDPHDLPACLPADRWEKDPAFAVMKKGRKSALRVLDSRKEAEEWKRANGGTNIVARPGERVRCERYCRVAEWCPDFCAFRKGA